MAAMAPPKSRSLHWKSPPATEKIPSRRQVCCGKFYGNGGLRQLGSWHSQLDGVERLEVGPAGTAQVEGLQPLAPWTGMKPITGTKGLNCNPEEANIPWIYDEYIHEYKISSELIESSKFCCRTFTSWVTWLTTWFMIHQCDSDS